jgi:hypothetical protein
MFFDAIIAPLDKKKVEAYGATYDNTIALVRDMAKYTPEHEVVHLTLGNIEKISAFKGMTREKLMQAKADQMGVTWSERNDIEIEEGIAKDFEKYLENKYKPKGIIKRFFERLRILLTKVAKAIRLTNGDIIRDYYDVLDEGKSLDETITKLESKGIIEQYANSGVLEIKEIERFKIRGDKYLQKLKKQFNDLANKQENLEKKVVSWNENLDETLNENARNAKAIESLPEEVKEVSRYTKRDPKGKLTEKGKDVVETLEFANVDEAQEAIYKYLRRKNDIIQTRNKLSELRKQIASARKEGREVSKEMRDVERKLKLRRRLLERKDYYIDMGMKRGAKEQLRMIKRRSRVISSIQDFFQISDTKKKQIIGTRNVHLMSEEQFNNFIIEFSNRANKYADLLSAKNELDALLQEKQFNKVDNLSRAMGIKPFRTAAKELDDLRVRIQRKIAKNKDVKDLVKQEYDLLDSFDRLLNILRQYEVGDTFLTQRQLETIHRTQWGDIKTVRELHEKIYENTQIRREDLETVEIDRTFQKYKNWLQLSRQNPMFAWIVDLHFKAKISSEMEYVAFEEKLKKFSLEARRSRKKGIKEKIIQSIAPTEEIVFGYIESPNKKEYIKKKQMTDKELAYGDFLIGTLYNPAKEHMESEYGMLSRINYVPHLRRGFMEALMSSIKGGKSIRESIKQATSEMLAGYKEEEKTSKILGGKTDKVVAFEKWFSFAMPRNGSLAPTRNLAKASLIYARAYFNKKEIDAYTPEIMVVVKAQQDLKGYTEKGLPVDPSVEEFVTQYVNNARGRKIDLLTTQGDALNNALQMGIAWTAFKYLGFRIRLGAVNFLGEFVGAIRATTPKEAWRGIKRTLNIKKSHSINQTYKYFTGRNPLVELFDPEHNVTTRIKDSAMLLFSMASFFNNRFYLRAKMTEEEWQSELMTDERMLTVVKEMSKWRKTPFYISSLAGSTAEASAFNQFAKWALPIVNTTVSDLEEMIKNTKKDGLKKGFTSEEAKSLGITISLMGIIWLITMGIKAMDPDDDPENRDTFFYVTRELNTFLGAFQTIWEVEGRLPLLNEILRLWDLMSQVYSQEEYQRDGMGYKQGDKKWVKTLERFMLPSAIKQLLPEQQESLKDSLIEDALQSGELNADMIVSTLYSKQLAEKQDDLEDYKEYFDKKVGEIKALYHFKQKYPKSKVGQIILENNKNEDRVNKMIELSKEIGIDMVYNELKELYRDRKLCSNTTKKTGCMVSGTLFKEFIKAKKKL